MRDRPETSASWRQRAGYLQSQIAIAAQDWEGAAQYLEQCVALEQQAGADELDAALCWQVAYWQGEVEYQQLHWEAAEAKFARAAELVEGKMEAHWGVIAHRQALLAARRQAWREGLEHIDRLERTYRDYAQRDAVDYLHGRCLFGLAHVREAREKWEQLIARTSEKPSQWTAQAHWMIGESYLVQRKYETALAAYDAAIALRDFPHWQAAALVQSAKCCDALGRPAEATARYERVVREFSHTPYYALAARQFDDETPRVAQQPETETNTQR
jgi:tetratricopeptide (TPR) repeat protein